MIDITSISEIELRLDLNESIKDVAICAEALKLNITTYSGGSVQERLDTNLKIIDKINYELNRRGCGKVRDE